MVTLVGGVELLDPTHNIIVKCLLLIFLNPGFLSIGTKTVIPMKVSCKARELVSTDDNPA